jgi:WhiB family redox-sensing transcriptional regulator
MSSRKQKEPMFDTSTAACFKVDPDIFMPEGVDHIKITREAKAVCATCPLVETCLDYAINNDEWGVWGGSTMQERMFLRRYPTRKAEYIDALIESSGQRDFVKLTDENSIL